MALTKGGLLQPQGMTTVERDLLMLAGADVGRLIYNETTSRLQQWTGSAWIDVFFTSDTLPFTQITGQAVTEQLADASVTDVKVADVSGSKLIGEIDGGTYI